MSKIVISVVTEMEFESEKDFKAYLETDYQANVTGFSDEIKKAWQEGARLNVKTPRVEIGSVTRSYVSANRILNSTSRKANNED